MPEVNFMPVNQCTPSDPSDGADPAYAQTEPARPTFQQPLACLDQAPGADGQSGDCAQELVQRHQSSSCSDEALRALGTCGKAVLGAGETSGLTAAFDAAGCLGALGGLLECVVRDDSVR
jgi:hypothetical protein